MQGGEEHSPRDAGYVDPGRAAAGVGQSGDRGPDAMIPLYSPGQARTGADGSWISPRGPVLRYGGLALLGALLIGTMIFLTLPTPTRTTIPRAIATTPAPLSSPTLHPPFPVEAFTLPAFSDWRAAYLDTNGVVHVASLDGTSDDIGPVLHLNTADTTNGVGIWVAANTAASYTSIAVAPNGRYFAYINAAPLPPGAGVAPPSGPLALVNLASDAHNPNDWTALSLDEATVTHIAGWSPDSTRVAIDATVNGVHGIYVAAAGSAKLQLILGTDDQGALANSHATGWLDNTHLLLITTGAGTALPPVAQASAPRLGNRGALSAPLTAPRSSNGNSSLATVDVTSGTAYEITRVPESAVVALSPDGKQIEAYSGCQAGCPVLAPEIVDTATGRIHALPNSASALALQGIALWQPGGSSLAVTITGQGPPNRWSVNLVNTQTDSAREVQSPAYAIAWTPDGRHLLLGGSSSLADGEQQTQVTIVSPDNGFTAGALSLPMAAFIGFVKTA